MNGYVSRRGALDYNSKPEFHRGILTAAVRAASHVNLPAMRQNPPLPDGVPRRARIISGLTHCPNDEHRRLMGATGWLGKVSRMVPAPCLAGLTRGEDLKVN